jgi:tetratricopeptide (TPR) repeat protein
MLQRAALAAFLLLVAGTAFAQSGGRQGYVILKNDDNGRKIEGKISVHDGKVTIESKYGSADYNVDDVTITYTDKDTAPAAPGPGAGSNPAAPAGGSKKRVVKVEKKDGTTITGEVVEETAESITIKPHGGSVITLRLSDTNGVTPVDDVSPADVDLGDRYVDFLGRFQLEKPSADWTLRKSTSPEMRALMVLNGKDAFVAVSVKPILTAINQAYLDPTKDNAKKAQNEIDNELKTEFEAHSGIQLDAGELFGTPVIECRYDANNAEEGTYQYIEERFVREGLLYRIKAAAEKKNTFKDVESKLRDAFQSFSFIPAQGGDDQAYCDLLKGFGIERPSPKWTIDAHPFDDKEPVDLRNEDGRAVIRVVCQDANGQEAAAFVDQYLKAGPDKSEFAVLDKKDGHRGESPVVTYHCTFFEGRDAKKCDEQGLVAVADTKLIHVIGTAPFADADAKDLQKEVLKALDAFKVLDPKRKHLGDGALAVQAYASGMDQIKKKNYGDALNYLKDAIKYYPDYAQAYFARAKCDIEQKAWKEYRDDLARVFELDPRPETAVRASVLYLAEANARAKDKDWKDACTAWKEAVRADPKNEKMRTDFMGFFKAWWADAKQKINGGHGKEQVTKIKEAIDEIADARWNDKEFDGPLAAMFVDAGQQILSASDRKAYRAAREYAVKAQGLNSASKEAKDLKKQCDDAQKQFENQPKK